MIEILTKKAMRIGRAALFLPVITTDAKDVAGNQLDQNPNIAGNQQKVWFFITRN